MTKKQRKQTIVKRLVPVLLAIILGASSVPAALAEEIAPEQNAAGTAAEKETSNGTASLENAVESREAGTEEAANAFQTGAEENVETPADATTPTDTTEEAAETSIRETLFPIL